MSKHTPGPWKVSSQSGDGLPGCEGLVGVVGPEQTSSRGHKFTLYVAQYVKPEDADLIAAAPELLEKAIAVVRAASIGDQNFIPCLLRDEEGAKLRRRIVELSDLLKGGIE